MATLAMEATEGAKNTFQQPKEITKTRRQQQQQTQKQQQQQCQQQQTQNQQQQMVVSLTNEIPLCLDCL